MSEEQATTSYVETTVEETTSAGIWARVLSLF